MLTPCAGNGWVVDAIFAFFVYRFAEAHDAASFSNCLIPLLHQRVQRSLSFIGLGRRSVLDHNQMVEREVSKYFASVLSEE